MKQIIQKKPMTENDRKCAVCGSDRIYQTPGLPVDWELYLRENREWTPINSVRIPLCGSCYPEYDVLKSGGYSPESSDNDDVQEILDEITLENLIDQGF